VEYRDALEEARRQPRGCRPGRQVAVTIFGGEAEQYVIDVKMDT
jgi:hypothetical protein